MKSSTIEFPQNARRVYTAVRCTFEGCDQFHRVRCDDRNYVVTAKHGASLLALGENVKVHVVAIGTQSCKVVIESANQVFINLFNIGSNKRNVIDLSDFISNQVYRLCSDEEIKLTPSNIRIVQPDIKFYD